jgi:hypothetical protein
MPPTAYLASPLLAGPAAAASVAGYTASVAGYTASVAGDTASVAEDTASVAEDTAGDDMFSKHPSEVPTDLLEGDFKEW